MMVRNWWNPGSSDYSILAYADALSLAGVETTFQVSEEVQKRHEN